MRLKATLISLFSILVVGLTAILIYCFWPAIKGTVDNSKYYTQEELQNSYDKGYDDGCKSETELTGQVKYYKGLVDEYYIQVNTLNDEITMLTKNNKDYQTQVNNLTTQKTNLQTQVENLTTAKTNNENTIASLNSQITSLQTQVTNLTNSDEDKSEQIIILNNQITTLKNTVSQLQTTNDMNVTTITSLNTQIANLNSQISEITLSSQNSASQINSLNSKINELQSSITYYESYIAQLENGEQVVATFEFDGSVYNIQIVNKGSTLSVTTPASTTYKIFNGWAINGTIIDLNTYTITTNTKIVADVTYKYDVKFMSGNNVVDSQIVTKNNYATLPTNPTKDGYEFDGWSTNGVDIVDNILTIPVTANTTYVAVFTKLHTVTFMYENETKSTQTIRNGSYATAPTIESTPYKVFNGWLVNGIKTNISTYKIVADTVIIANVTYKYDVKFMSDDNVIDSQIVTKNNYATLPTNPTKDGYEFDGWSTNGVDIVDNILTIPVTANTTYVAVFTKLYTVTFMYENETVSIQTIRSGNCATNVTIDSTDYKVFNGWKIDNDIVNVTQYKITQTTIFYADFTIKTVSLTIQNFLNYVYSVGQSTITSVVFDYYTNNDEYIVNGANVINGVSEKSLDNNNTIKLYQNGTALYVLSNYNIQIDTGKLLFTDMRSLTLLKLNNFNTSNVKSMSNMFSGCKALTSLDLTCFNTNNVTDMSYMFSTCSSLTSLNLSNFNTCNVTDMSNMFQNCVALTNIDISSFDTHNVTNMSGMFDFCKALTSLDLSSFNTTSVRYMMRMFDCCSKLVTLDLSNFNTDNVTRFDSMFSYCSMLKTIYANENFTTISVVVDTASYIDGKANTFFKCENLTGAISYDSSKTDVTYANYTTGYFTYKAKQ